MLKEAFLEQKTQEELSHIISSLQSDLTGFKESQKQYQQKIKEQELTITYLMEQIRLNRYLRFASKSEKDTGEPYQPSLFDEAKLPNNLEDIKQADEELTIPSHMRKKKAKGGRKPLPESLPREQKIHDLTEQEKQCPCGHKLTAIGEDKSEQLGIIPAKIFVIEHIKKKYACKNCEETIKQAKLPPQPIPKSMASPGLLAHIIVSKFDYHLPLYRQEKILQHIGIDLPRSTLSHWVLKCAELLEPLIKLMQYIVQTYDVAYADETKVQVLKEGDRPPQKKSFMWSFAGGSLKQFCILFHYHISRGHEVPLGYLEDFTGYLHCDGYSAYDTLASKTGLTQVGCWFHMRRKFVETAKVGENAKLANWMIKKIKLLSMIERTCSDRKLTPEEIKAYRLKMALPIIQEIKVWLDEKSLTVLPKSLLGIAIFYALNQWPKLLNYLEDGRLEMSTNRIERIIKLFATGRKNWLFSNSIDGANAAATLYSLLETAKHHKLHPYAYFAYALQEIPLCQTEADLEKLLPFNIDQTCLEPFMPNIKA